jgi:hypothetical protein
VVLHQVQLSGANASVTSYTFEVPAGAHGVNVSVYNEGYDATPDLDVFVRKDGPPSLNYQDPDYCDSPFGGEEGRHCSFSSVDQPLGGTWHVSIKGWGYYGTAGYGGGSGDGWELKATYY